MNAEPEDQDIRISVKLTPYDWHALLKDMEEHMQIINRNGNITKALYCEIASQLAGQPITIKEPK